MIVFASEAQNTSVKRVSAEGLQHNTPVLGGAAVGITPRASGGGGKCYEWLSTDANSLAGLLNLAI